MFDYQRYDRASRVDVTEQIASLCYCCSCVTSPQMNRIQYEPSPVVVSNTTRTRTVNCNMTPCTHRIQYIPEALLRHSVRRRTATHKAQHHMKAELNQLEVQLQVHKVSERRAVNLSSQRHACSPAANGGSAASPVALKVAARRLCSRLRRGGRSFVARTTSPLSSGVPSSKVLCVRRRRDR